MSFNWETIGDKVYGILAAAGYGIQMRDDKGQATMDPHKAIRFLATVKSQDPKLDTYNVLIGLHDEDAYSHLDFRTPKTVSDADFDTITNLKNSIQKNLGDIEGLKINWTPFGSSITLKDDPVKKISESKDISKVYGTMKSSYQKVGESKLIIRHSDPIDESKQGSRWRKIRAVFIETKEGERFKYQHPHVSGARALARHISEGGNTHDFIGQGIANMSDDYMNLKRANMLLRHAGKHDDSVHVRNAMKDINHNLRRMSGPRGYRSAQDLMKSQSNRYDTGAAGNLSKQLLVDCGCSDDTDKAALDTAAKYIVKIGSNVHTTEVPGWLKTMLQNLATKLSDREHLDQIMGMTQDVEAGKIPDATQIRWAAGLAKDINAPAQDPEVDRIRQLSGI